MLNIIISAIAGKTRTWVIVICSLLTSFGALVFAHMTASQISETFVIVSGIVAIGNTILGLYKSPPGSSGGGGIPIIGGAVALSAGLMGCTPTQEAAIVSSLEQTMPIACQAVAVLDPSVMTVVCAIVDDLDGILVPLTPVTAPAADAKAFVAKHPDLPTLRQKYAAAKLAK